jgi:hypothetical protein
LVVYNIFYIVFKEIPQNKLSHSFFDNKRAQINCKILLYVIRTPLL